MGEVVVLDKSALLDLLLGTAEGMAVQDSLYGREVHITDHEEVEVASALQAMGTSGMLSQLDVERMIRRTVEAPFSTHLARELLVTAVQRSDLRLSDALCVELSHRLTAPLLTTDSRLAAAWPHSWLVTALPAKP
ncbi:MAG: PIN domain-containing protein [Candidatus Dormiibacterota bacterium]